MLLPFLIVAVIIFGAIVYYIYILSPRLNPITRAESFLRQNMVREAILEYKKILDKDPRNFTIHNKLANLYIRNKMIDQAVMHLEEIIKINKFNYEVDRTEIMRKLAKGYHFRDEFEKAFQAYLNILAVYPGDFEAMYQVAFMLLGQEQFDQAYRYFDRLVEHNKNNFEVMYGAGMACYMFQKANEAVDYFSLAASLNPGSDIANLSAAFAYQRRRDYKNAIVYARKILDSSSDATAVFIANRLLALLLAQAKKYEESYEAYQNLIQYETANDMPDELILTKYDFGFAYLKGDDYHRAYDIWNQVYQADKAFRNIQSLITILRRELSPEQSKTDVYSESLRDQIDKWVLEYFPENYLWKICGLKSDKVIDLKNIVTTTRISSGEAKFAPAQDDMSLDLNNIIEKYMALDTENFKIISNRAMSKLGYSVDQILNTYKEADGVDFMARDLTTGEQTLIWVRRWKGMVVGEIPLRNLAQAITDSKSKKGVFVTTSYLTPSAEMALPYLSRVKVVYPHDYAEILRAYV